MGDTVEFDWDEQNRKHLAAHRVKPTEVEQVLNGEPLDLSFEFIRDEERYRSVGLTHQGRLLSVAWTIRNGKIRAITGFPATHADKRAFLTRSK